MDKDLPAASSAGGTFDTLVGRFAQVEGGLQMDRNLLAVFRAQRVYNHRGGAWIVREIGRASL